MSTPTPDPDRRPLLDHLIHVIQVSSISGFVSGLALGIGKAEWSAKPDHTPKIRAVRAVCYGVTRGRKLGSMAGMVGFTYAGMERAFGAARGKDDWINTVGGGLGTGALFGAMNGARSAAVGGVLGGVVAGAAVVGKRVVDGVVRFHRKF